MFRVSKMSHNTFAVRLPDNIEAVSGDSMERILTDIWSLAQQGNSVLVVDDLEEASAILDIPIDDIEIVT